MEPGRITLELAPEEGRFRSSEGAFVTLTGGRILLAYTKFTSGYADHAGAAIVSRLSADGGQTWAAQDEPVVPNEAGLNVMSVSLLRPAEGLIALFYLHKDSHQDCRPRMRLSSDEGRTWSPPTEVIAREGYYVVNNDRVVQLSTGRLIVPACRHETVVAPGTGAVEHQPGQATFFLSDDGGRTWRRSQSIRSIGEPASRSGLQEPGVVELRDGRLFAFCRTDRGCQYGLYSRDRGKTWSEPFRTGFISPLSPMSIKRIGGSGELLALYNDHSGRFGLTEDRGRQPLVSAISRDEGATWVNHKQVESDLSRGYHYTAIHFVGGGRVLLAYCAGPRGPGRQLNTLRVRLMDAEWFLS
jgi:hypothetical protein